MYNPQMYLLATLESHTTLTDHNISDIIIRWAKGERKGKTKVEILEQLLNIYTEMDSETFIENALQDNLIEVIEITENGRKLQLSAEGRLTLAIYLTNNFSQSYKVFADRFEKITLEKEQLPLPKMTVMKFYHSGCDPEDISTTYFKNRPSNEISRDFHEHLIRVVAGHKDKDDNKYVFHLAPRLFVPHDLMGKKVTLEIDGLEEQTKLMVTSPYPNKRYYIAGMKQGRMNTACGIYPVIGTKEDFPVFKEFTLRWTIDGHIRVNHHLEIDFQFTSQYGHLFSTEQRFNRNLAAIDSHTITTSLDRESYNNRNAKIIVHDIYDHFEIQESVTLTNFPIELHAFSKSGTYFDRWYRDWSLEYKERRDDNENKLHLSKQD